LKWIKRIVDNQLKYIQSLIVAVIALIGLLMAAIGLGAALSSCTLNVIMTHTEGSATDVVDSDPSTKADPNVAIHLPVIP
jgi:hypothetical protein